MMQLRQRPPPDPMGGGGEEGGEVQSSHGLYGIALNRGKSLDLVFLNHSSRSDEIECETNI